MTKLHYNAIDLTNQPFGCLTVLKPTKKRESGHVVWLCICSCGNECLIRSDSLQNERTKSCGCLQKKLAKNLMITHGMKGFSIYNIWHGMLNRCENPKHLSYKYYGGRGIKVCERWHDIHNFYADVGDPHEGMTLDRWPDNDGDYKPTNFRWTTPQEQAKNRRDGIDQRWFFAYNENTGEWDEDNNQYEFAYRRNLDNSHISKCLNNKRPRHKGWIFQWIPKQQGDRI